MKQHGNQREYWRSLKHLAGSSELAEAAGKEFAGYDPAEMMSLAPTTRRRFMQLAAASMALAGLTLSGCRRWPEEKLAPYAARPQDRMPGVPLQFATAMEIGGVAQPLLVTSFDGRPIKIEGNPTHPFSQTIPGKVGAATAIAQASILDLYDPNRSRTVIDNTGGKPRASDFAGFKAALEKILAEAGDGSRMAVLVESTSSPSTVRLRQECVKRFPGMSWCEYQPLPPGPENTSVLHLDKAAVIVSFDADLLGGGAAQIRYASDWASRRRTADQGEMSRMYCIESAVTLTGTVADVRVPAKPLKVLELLRALAAAMGLNKGMPTAVSIDDQKLVNQIAADLKANKGKSVIAVGEHVPDEGGYLAMKINDAIGAIDHTITLYSHGLFGGFPTISHLAKWIDAKNFDTLLILGGNPAYDAPADLEFAAKIKSLPNTIDVAHYYDETSVLCKWHVPRAHYLESWGDCRTLDGVISIVQPLIEPLFGGKTIDEVLAVVCASPEADSDAIVRKTFANMSDGDFRKALHDGLIAGSVFPVFEFNPTNPTRGVPLLPPIARGADGTFDLRFLPSPGMYDGRFAANGWLQEFPDPLTKIVWDNAALISKADADALKVATGDMLIIRLNGKEISIVAYVLPGQPKGVIGLPLGYGRTQAGPIGTGVGVDVNPLRTYAAQWIAVGATVTKTGRKYDLATTEDQYLIDSIGFAGRQERTGTKGSVAELIREATLDDYQKTPLLFKKTPDGNLALQLFDPPSKFNQPDAWGMAVDMNSCIGCGACVIACQAENNIPIVGKEQAMNHRTMHWIRIDRYFRGDAADPANDPNPEVVYQPVMCQHCENAPCEQVCPVGATMHDSEGLNVMVYNRCIGTRYCSNNCPYKVRRFNYLDWQSQDPRHDKFPPPFLGLPDQQQLQQVDAIKRMVFNPDVTVRMRGVMEKCTYCVQRIHSTRTARRAAGKELADGDVLTACQQTCPTQAIVFGNLNDPNSSVSLLHKNQRTYALLDDLETRPRTRYLGKVRNPGVFVPSPGTPGEG